MYSILHGSGFRADWASGDAVRQWVSLSEHAYTWNRLGRPTASNASLEQAAKEDGASPLASVYRTWCLQHLLRDAQLEEAVAYGEALLPRLQDVFIGQHPLATHAYTSLASAHQALGEPEQAAEVLRRWVRSKSAGAEAGQPWAELGLALARLGRREEAYRSFSEAARRAVTDDARAQALGSAGRLEMRVDWTATDPETVAQRLVRALLRRDTDALDGIASRSHFSFGLVASESMLCDRGQLLAQLRSDLRGSAVRGDPGRLLGAGGKRYLVTSGWSGRVFQGGLWFILIRRYDGWEWGGVAPTHDSPEVASFYRRLRGGPNGRLPTTTTVGGLDARPAPRGPAPTPRFAPPTIPGDSGDVLRRQDFRGLGRAAPTAPLAVRRLWPESDHDRITREMDRRMNLLAPWPAGDSFQAGGLGWFFSGGLLWIGDVAIPTASAPSDPFLFILYSSLRECGLGSGGAYSQEFWHEDGDAYAIDFVSYERGSLMLDDFLNGVNRSKGVAVLAPSEGCVVNLRSNVPEGEDEDRGDNFVEMECFLSGQPTPYTTISRHLAGPRRLTVNVFQHVRQGYRLGHINDTGKSVYDHVHFEVHDRRLNGDWDPLYDGVLPTGRTVRMTLEGQQMTPDRAGICITSTNTEVVPGAAVGAPPRGIGAGTATGGTVADRDTGTVRSRGRPDPDRQPKAFCFWTADQQEDALLGHEIRRVCRLMPDDPPLVRHRERRG